jgi:Arc/MetJ family transcription regulator
MATNLAIDDALIEEAKRIGRHRTKKEAVTAALEEYIRHRKRLELIEMAGEVDYLPGYDHKALRKEGPR